jgi:hypothetical protein
LVKIHWSFSDAGNVGYYVVVINDVIHLLDVQVLRPVGLVGSKSFSCLCHKVDPMPSHEHGPV